MAVYYTEYIAYQIYSNKYNNRKANIHLTVMTLVHDDIEKRGQRTHMLNQVLDKDFRIESIHKIQCEHSPSTYTSLIQYQYQLPGLKFIDHFQVCEVRFIVTKKELTKRATYVISKGLH
jgi:hypothetical protein